MKNRGFTLVELLVVVAIIGVLSAALLVGINPLEQTRKAKDSGKLKACKEAIGAAERYYGFFNANPAYGGTGQPATLCDALISAEELKSGSCTSITVAGSGTYTCTFVPDSTTFKKKCNVSGNDTTCTVPTEF